jgi:uncharacterized membrane protein
VREARRLVDAMGWAVVLPHMLAVLGLLFSEAGVGKAVAHVVTDAVPLDGAPHRLRRVLRRHGMY